jgi:hypothetical protein
MGAAIESQWRTMAAGRHQRHQVRLSTGGIDEARAG